jgi:hypothetical protein
MDTDILEGWKAISQFLEVSEKTAITYYKHKGLLVKKNRAGHPVIRKTIALKWRLGE